MTDFSRRDFFKLLATSTLSLNYKGITHEEAKKFRQLWQKRYQCNVDDYLCMNFRSAKMIGKSIARELENHQMVSVFGMLMTKTEFALLAYLNK
jgi:hypothetical protein